MKLADRLLARIASDHAAAIAAAPPPKQHKAPKAPPPPPPKLPPPPPPKPKPSRQEVTLRKLEALPEPEDKALARERRHAAREEEILRRRLMEGAPADEADVYIPTPAEIEAGKAEIQAKWEVEDHRRRSFYDPGPATDPEYGDDEELDAEQFVADIIDSVRTPKARIKTRNCLRCGRPFRSLGPFNRRCHSCQEQTQKHEEKYGNQKRFISKRKIRLYDGDTAADD